MTINELLALTGLTANDEIPVWDTEAAANTKTKKITAQNLAASIKTLASLIASSDLDTTPTSGSTKAVQSGGVYDAIQQSTAKISSGIYRPSEPVPANGRKDYTIAYGKTYSNPPVIVANCREAFTPITELTGPNIVSIGTNSFIVRYKSSYNADLTPETTWIAIGT